MPRSAPCFRLAPSARGDIVHPKLNIICYVGRQED
jgi:hypothetical protein